MGCGRPRPLDTTGAPQPKKASPPPGPGTKKARGVNHGLLCCSTFVGLKLPERDSQSHLL
jgi:hypothetical protein